MIFQFSDGEFSGPIATSLKMRKKINSSIVIIAFSVTSEKLNRNPQACPPAPPPLPKKNFLHAVFLNILKATWLKRLHESCSNASWSHIPLSLLKEVGGSFLFECNYDLKCLKVLWIAETFSIMASTCMACCLFEDIVGMI